MEEYTRPNPWIELLTERDLNGFVVQCRKAEDLMDIPKQLLLHVGGTFATVYFSAIAHSTHVDFKTEFLIFLLDVTDCDIPLYERTRYACWLYAMGAVYPNLGYIPASDATAFDLMVLIHECTLRSGAKPIIWRESIKRYINEEKHRTARLLKDLDEDKELSELIKTHHSFMVSRIDAYYKIPHSLLLTQTR